MLAGRRPFEGDSYLQTLTAILRDPPPPLRTIRPEVPPKLERVVARALEQRLSDTGYVDSDETRPPSASGERKREGKRD